MANDWIDIQTDPKHVSAERRKAREIKQSNWWKEQLARGICHYCGEHFDADELTMDHVIPVARGGYSTRTNIVPACFACNQKKKYLTPAEQALAELEEKGLL